MVKHGARRQRVMRAQRMPSHVPYNEVLRLARLAAGLTQFALAERVGVTEGMISRLESGARQRPSYTTMVRIGRALGVPHEQLFPVPDVPGTKDDAA